MYIVLSNLLDSRVFNGLRIMVVGPEWAKLKATKTNARSEAASIILESAFWDNAKLIVKICAPILKISRLANRQGACMGLDYELADHLVEKIHAMNDIEAGRLNEIKSHMY